MLKHGGNKKLFDFLRIYQLHNEPMETRYYTKACQLYRDVLKAAGENDEPFMVTLEFYDNLAREEGKKSIYGVRPSVMYKNQ